jgi:3-phosphoshikimate 1-carboxyvinyltransferase
MDRIVAPLQEMGVPIVASPGGHAPLTIASRPPEQRLRALNYRSPVASAQVKTCLMLAALGADGPSSLIEPALSRDHTERMLAAMGIAIQTFQEGQGWRVALRPPSGDLKPLQMVIPGDFSAAAFLIVAATIAPGSQITLRNLGLNPTRTGLLTTLGEMGADIRVSNCVCSPASRSETWKCVTRPCTVSTWTAERAVAMIDEFRPSPSPRPARGRTEVSQAGGCGSKKPIASRPSARAHPGSRSREKADGFVIEGFGTIPAAGSLSLGDHRLAMALAVAGLATQNPIGVRSAEITESYPGLRTACAPGCGDREPPGWLIRASRSTASA